MSRLERMLEDKKNEYEKMEAPDTLEAKLREGLQGRAKPRRKIPLNRIAAIILLVSLLTYNSSTLAYYGKQFMGYENIMEGTILQLSRQGKGQIVNKVYTFRDGIEVRLDGVMLDGNGMVFFYTVEDLKKTRDIQEIDVRVLPRAPFIDGNSSGMGEILVDEGIQKWIMTAHKAPPFFIRTVSLQLSRETEDGSWEEGEIKFRLDRNQAVGDTVRARIDMKVELAGRTMTIESISKSPISTIVSGEIQDLLSLALDRTKGDLIMPQNLEMSLFADGKEISRVGSGISTNMKGTRFEIRFDTIPDRTKELRLVLDQATAVERISDEYPISEGESLIVGDAKIDIGHIKVENGGTHIEITTDAGTRIPGVELRSEEKSFGLLSTSESIYDKVESGGSVQILSTRTLEFEGSGGELKLYIDHIYQTVEYGITVYEESIE